jgi:hypothetical protein
VVHAVTRFEFRLRRTVADFVYPEGAEERARGAAEAEAERAREVAEREAAHREVQVLFHQLWSAAGTANYNKAAWSRLQWLLQRLGIPV